MQLFIDRMPSPVGVLTLVWDEHALRALDFDGFEDRFQRLLAAHYGNCPLTQSQVPDRIRHAIDAYFAGDLDAVKSLEVRTNGTPFQQQVWKALREIPAGTTMSYGQLASRIGNPGSSRAIGRANGANPIGIVIPCHRVIGADGSLTGYGGGMDRKRWLLDHEQKPLLRLAV